MNSPSDKELCGTSTAAWHVEFICILIGSRSIPAAQISFSALWEKFFRVIKTTKKLNMRDMLS